MDLGVGGCALCQRIHDNNIPGPCRSESSVDARVLLLSLAVLARGVVVVVAAVDGGGLVEMEEEEEEGVVV